MIGFKNPIILKPIMIKPVDYEKLRVIDLIELIKERGIKGYSKKPKVVLIQMLRDRDAIDAANRKGFYPRTPSPETTVPTTVQGNQGNQGNPQIQLDVGENLTVTFKNLELQDFFDLIEYPTDADDKAIDADYARLVRDLMTQEQIQALGDDPQIMIRPLLIEFNHFNGTGYHYQDMDINLRDIPGIQGTIISPVEGYINFKYNEGYPYGQYLYSFNVPKGPGYLAILHQEGAGYGNYVETTMAFLLPN